MKQFVSPGLHRLLRPLLLALFLCKPLLSQANHVMGGELTYVHLSTSGSNQTYKVVLTLFADCASASTTTAFGLLSTATPQVTVLNNNAPFASLSLTNDPALSNIEITPVCPEQQDSTKCTSLTYTIPGVVKFVYTADVTLTSASANWKFAFDGTLVNSSAGRSASIANINTLGGAQLMYLEATLNNTGGNNSSTNYTSPPTPFFCINVPQSYSLNAVDPNNDSLTFSLIGAKVSALANAPYIPPYTPTNPLPAAPGTFSFNNTNGLLNFTPNIAMQAVVVNLVEEYRNGVKVGTSMREMTFVILPTCANTAPNPGTINVNNGTVSGNNEIEVCEGMTDTLRLGFTAQDAEGDTLNITVTNLPPGATVSISNNNTPSPHLSFTWDVRNVPLGNYTFFVTIEDDGCPLAGKQTVPYTIKIVPFQGLLNTGFSAGCRNQNNGFAWIHRLPSDTSKYSFTWRDANAQIIHTSGGYVITDTLKPAPPGVYIVEFVNEKGCHAADTITVTAPGYHTTFTSPAHGCVNVPVSFNNTSTADVTSFVWDFGDGTTGTAISPTHNYTQPGTYTVRLIGTTGFPCEDTAYATIQIHEVKLQVSNTQTICRGASTPLYALGAQNYVWTPATGLSCTDCQAPTASPTATTIYTITGSDAFGCSATANIEVIVIPAGLMSVTPVDTAICPGDSVHMHASGALSYRWTPDVRLSDTTGATVTAFPQGNITYTVYGAQQAGCVDTQEVVVHVLPNAVLSLPDSVRIYPGESYQMDPGGNCLYFAWFPPLGLSSTTIANPLASPPVNTRYFIEAATEAGCRVSDSIDVYVNLESLIGMPNAFTPGAAPNDLLKVERRGIAQLKHFKVFNRWGQTIFETTDINKGWDGTLNGQPQPMGVYVYTIEAITYSGKQVSKQGNVTLIR